MRTHYAPVVGRSQNYVGSSKNSASSKPMFGHRSRANKMEAPKPTKRNFFDEDMDDLEDCLMQLDIPELPDADPGGKENGSSSSSKECKPESSSDSSSNANPGRTQAFEFMYRRKLKTAGMSSSSNSFPDSKDNDRHEASNLLQGLRDEDFFDDLDIVGQKIATTIQLTQGSQKPKKQTPQKDVNKNVAPSRHEVIDLSKGQLSDRGKAVAKASGSDSSGLVSLSRMNAAKKENAMMKQKLKKATRQITVLERSRDELQSTAVQLRSKLKIYEKKNDELLVDLTQQAHKRNKPSIDEVQFKKLQKELNVVKSQNQAQNEEMTNLAREKDQLQRYLEEERMKSKALELNLQMASRGMKGKNFRSPTISPMGKHRMRTPRSSRKDSPSSSSSRRTPMGTRRRPHTIVESPIRTQDRKSTQESARKYLVSKKTHKRKLEDINDYPESEVIAEQILRNTGIDINGVRESEAASTVVQCLVSSPETGVMGLCSALTTASEVLRKYNRDQDDTLLDNKHSLDPKGKLTIEQRISFFNDVRQQLVERISLLLSLDEYPPRLLDILKNILRHALELRVEDIENSAKNAHRRGAASFSDSISLKSGGQSKSRSKLRKLSEIEECMQKIVHQALSILEILVANDRECRRRIMGTPSRGYKLKIPKGFKVFAPAVSLDTMEYDEAFPWLEFTEEYEGNGCSRVLIKTDKMAESKTNEEDNCDMELEASHDENFIWILHNILDMIHDDSILAKRKKEQLDGSYNIMRKRVLRIIRDLLQGAPKLSISRYTSLAEHSMIIHCLAQKEMIFEKMMTLEIFSCLLKETNSIKSFVKPCLKEKSVLDLLLRFMTVPPETMYPVQFCILEFKATHHILRLHTIRFIAYFFMQCGGKTDELTKIQGQQGQAYDTERAVLPRLVTMLNSLLETLEKDHISATTIPRFVLSSKAKAYWKKIWGTEPKKEQDLMEKTNLLKIQLIKENFLLIYALISRCNICNQVTGSRHLFLSVTTKLMRDLHPELACLVDMACHLRSLLIRTGSLDPRDGTEEDDEDIALAVT
mmetsp:Transcript_9815/g.14749  ORF Transcript_9815/g.14749 Transcript_9815/m.14749 type:complete len:1044 (-) Transcript_9815:133-3264(-)|eukprot:CAMPEP_0167744770 /NCGR_PEP_ID=MMETSP0110_2-20121227/2775_1 /TAXON_ID=629695 /ORGANISM="Gymnochlora sp., Strain CCMP2014" /LENGTH=1043 /DNA_ID=CAMNT_0007629327 /DNA_START=52 /DNA_END=3183 /DNA_ORIENTATION=+